MCYCVLGLVWGLRPNDVDIQLLARSRELMTSLEEETGVHTGFINNGGLFVANTKERLDEYKRLHSVRNCFKFLLIFGCINLILL